MSSGLCRSASLCFVLNDLSGQRPDRRFDAALKFRPSGRPSTMMIAQWHSAVQIDWGQDPVLQWTEMTKDQFWHRLTALPEQMVDALFGIKSANGKVGFDDLKALGQQLFSLLSNSTGNLQFHMPASVEGEDFVTMTQVKHTTPFAGCDVHDAHFSTYANFSVRDVEPRGTDCWLIDGQHCIANPPQLHFDKMPREVYAVHAYMVTNSLCFEDFLTGFDDTSYPTDSHAVRDFAYDGNLDVTEWNVNHVMPLDHIGSIYSDSDMQAYARCN